MVIILDNASDVFVQFISPFFGDNSIPVFHGKNCLNVNLGIGVRQNMLFYSIIRLNIASLTGLRFIGGIHCYLYYVPNGTVDGG